MSYKVHSRVPSSAEMDALNAANSPSETNPIVSVQDRRLVANGGVAGSVASASVFGSGRDGDLVFDGSAVTGFDLTGTAYVRNLGYDLHARSITVSDGYSIDMAGTRLRAFVGTLGNNVRIHNDAPEAVLGSYTSAAEPAGGASSGAGSIFYGGINGQSPYVHDSSSGGVGLSYNVGAVGPVVCGGLAQGGGNMNASAASAAQTISFSLGSKLSHHYYGDLFETLIGPFPYFRTGGIMQIAGGGGGGRGYNALGTGADNSGPNGGGGGGVLGIAIKELTCGTDCVFSANGASCVDSVSAYNGAPTGTAGGLGGSSGGGGGVLGVIIGQLIGSNLLTFEAKGGNGGAGAFTLGTITNTDTYLAEGGAGGGGGKVIVYIGTNYVGGTPTIDVSGGTAGASQAGATPSWSPNNTDGSTGLYHYYQAA